MRFTHLTSILRTITFFFLLMTALLSHVAHAKVMLDHPDLSTCYTIENPCSLMPIPVFSSIDLTEEVFTSDLTYIVQEVQPAKYPDQWTTLEGNGLALTNTQVDTNFKSSPISQQVLQSRQSYEVYVTYATIFILLACLIIFLLTYTPTTKSWHTQ